MASGRIQRRIDSLLDEADLAAAQNDWGTVEERARAVLAFDPENEDAAAYLAAAQRGAGRASVSLDPVAAPEPELPASFVNGRYVVSGYLGEGGRKQVYLAHDARLDRDVAFAVIKTEGLDATGRERIQREAQAMGRLSGHPHVVTVHDVGEAEGHPYIVSEYMAGGDVESLLEAAEGHQLELERAVAIVDQVAQALAHAHADGVIHRDLKPGNIWLAEDGTAKLGDFGLAFAASETRMTTEGTMLGTVAYMPPEQALGSAATTQSDLYSLGCVLYEMVTGRTPFTGEDAVAVISQHLNTKPVAPSWNRHDCPADLEALIQSLLAKTPVERPADAGAVRASLAALDLSGPGADPGQQNPLERLAQGVFVGREAEMQRLRRACDNALGGRGELVMLVGQPGIGKTRTTQELETYARMRGATVAWGRNHENSGAPPYNPWIQAGRVVGQAIGVGSERAPLQGLGVDFSHLVRLFPELRQMLPDFVEPEAYADPEAAQYQLFEAYTQFIAGAAQQAPLVLVLDDLHWTDKPSLLLLQHLARQLSGMRVLVLGTFRDTDLVRTHPLSEALATLNREGGFERLVLRGLSRDECAAYIRSSANVTPSASVLSRIHDETEGNPFFLSEVVNLMAQEGTLDATSLSDITIPDGVREALGRRLDRISEEANELLQIAAVVGREFPYETLALLSEVDDESTLRLVEEALDARVIEEQDQPGRYRFTHHLMQETLLNELSITRRVRIQGQIGDALERRYGERADERASRLAQHFVEAATLSGQHAAKAVRYSRLAAAQAQNQSAFAEAAAHYENCLTVLATSEDAGDLDEAELLVLHGIAARNTGENRAGYRSLMRAIDLRREAGDENGLGEATIEAVKMFMPPERMRALLQAALAPGDRLAPPIEGRLLGTAVRFRVFDEDEHQRALERARELAEAHDLPDVRAALAFLNGVELARAGRGPAAIPAWESAFEQYLAIGDFNGAADALWQVSVGTLTLRGDLDAGRQENERLLAFAKQRGQRFYQEQAAIGLAGILFLRGELEAFDAFMQTRSTDETFVRNSLHVARAVAQGDLEAAEGWLAAPEQAGGVPVWVAMIHANRALVAHLRRDTAALRDALQRTQAELATLDAAAAGGAVFGGIYSLDEAILSPEARELGLLDSAERLRNDRISGLFGPGSTTCATRLLAQIDEAQGRDAVAAAGYREAMRICRDQRVPIELGRSALGLARLERRRGNEVEALELAATAVHALDAARAPFYRDQALALQLELRGLADVDLTTSIEAVALSIESERPDLSTRAAPDGTVTLLFSDIENSTARTAELGDARWMEILREHNAIVRDQLAAHSGYEVKSMGDGFMLAFGSGVDGLRCAIGMQQAFATSNSERDEPVHVRIGLHTGEAIREADDFFGTHVNLAARIGAAAQGDEVLVSSLLKALTEASGEFRFGPSREVRLKGISEPQRVHAVEWR